MRPQNKAAAYEIADIEALQALWNGTAQPDQQRLALHWIVQKCAEIGEPNFSGDALAMAFCEGRRSVGIEVSRLVNLPDNVKAALRGKNA